MWNRQLAEPETGSREVAEVPFAWWMDVPGNPAEAIFWWQSRLAAARASSGLEDLGPDMSLVGAGDAYLRALAADGHPVPEDQLRPEPLSGGPIVLVREGKEVRGFLNLAAALATAADGDTFEIRSDRPQQRADVPEDRGSLTLRAGPGYRPAITGTLFVHCGSSLAIEGLSFLNESQLETEWRDRTSLEKTRPESAAWHPARLIAQRTSIS